MAIFGETMMKLTKSYLFALLCLFVHSVDGQTISDDCQDAIVLCADISASISNAGATADICGTCADGPTNAGLCAQDLNNTVWASFTTNATGGGASLDLAGMTFNNGAGFGTDIEIAVMEAGTACDQSTYSNINCLGSFGADGSANLTGLTPNTTYYVQVNGVMGGTNAAEVTMDISVSGEAVQPDPTTFVIGTENTTICQGENGEFYPETVPCQDGVIEWFVDGGSIGTTDTLNTAALMDGSQVSATITCPNECPVSSDSIQVNIDSVIVDAGEDQTIGYGASATLDGQGEGDPLWTPSNLVDNEASLSPSTSNTSSQTFTLYMTNANGCTNSDQVVIEVLPQLYPTKVITPNGDGINDFWEIGGANSYENIKVMIFDRWGQKLFTSIGYETKWDGTNHGRRLPSGTYYYAINVNEEGANTYSGFITLIH